MASSSSRGGPATLAAASPAASPLASPTSTGYASLSTYGSGASAASSAGSANGQASGNGSAKGSGGVGAGRGAGPGGVLSPVDVSDEIHVEALRSALASGDRQQPLDLAALLKAPDKLKKACRAGIPMAQRKQAWEAIVKLNTTSVSTDYQAAKLEVFGDVAHPTHFPHVPDFGSMMKWNENYIYLTHKRVDQAKTILCVLACSHATLTHCPLLPDLVCILLMFFDEAATYSLVERMLARSKQDSFYMTTNGADFLRWMKTYSILLSQKLETLHAHMLGALAVDPAKLFQVWLNRFFIQYLPVRTVMRIVDSYLMEGNKILFRVSLAILKIHSKSLLQCATQKAFLTKLHALMTGQSAGELLAAGFDIYLSRTGHIGKIQTHLDEHRAALLTNPPNSRHTQHFHLPRFNHQHEHVSELIGVEQLYSLWSWLPPSSMIQDPVLLYSSALHGYSYATLWRKACESAVGENTAIFILVRDAAGQVLGLYLNRPLPDPNDVARKKGARARVSLFTGNAASNATTSSEPLDPQSFLFVLRPYAECYKHCVIAQDDAARAKIYRLKQQRVAADADADLSRANAKAKANQSGGGGGPPALTRPKSSSLSGREDSQSFKPYGLSQQEHEGVLADSDLQGISARIKAATAGGGGGGGEALTIVVEDDQTVGAHAGALTDRFYTSTLGAHGSHAALTPHMLLSATDVGMSSHSLIVAPTGGLAQQHQQQPLNELFAGINTSPLPPSEEASPVAQRMAATLAASPASGAMAASQATPGAPSANFSLPPSASPSSSIASAIGSSPSHAATATPGGSNVRLPAQQQAVQPPPRPYPELKNDLSAAGEAMLLMTEEGFGIVETGGMVLFLSSDLKSGMSRPSRVFNSPSFSEYRAAGSAGASATNMLGKFAVTDVEVWSFAGRGSDTIEQLSPRNDEQRTRAHTAGSFGAQQASSDKLPLPDAKPAVHSAGR